MESLSHTKINFLPISIVGLLSFMSSVHVCDIPNKYIVSLGKQLTPNAKDKLLEPIKPPLTLVNFLE